MTPIGVALVVMLALLTGAAARAALPHAWYGGIAAAIVASTPLVWTLQHQPRLLLATMAVAGWLAASGIAHRTGRARWWAGAGAALGVGSWTAWSAVVVLPACALATVAIFSISRADRWRRRDAAAFLVSFGAIAAPLAAYVVWRWDDVRGVITVLRLYDAERFSVLQGIREMTSWVGLTARSGVYWDALDPGFLFLSGDVLLLPLAVLVPLGIWRLLDVRAPIGQLALAGLLLAPLPVALIAEPPAARRMYAFVPCAAVVAAYGVEQVVAWRRARRDVAETAEGDAIGDAID